jgi:glycosyltransferase involved in cell wall biosynthesis
VEEVTVVVTCFNYGRYVGEAVQSALDEGARVVVVDDGSTEPLPELPSGVELIRQENQGVARARNTGLTRVQTPYVLVLDADDRLAPGALEALREPLEADPQLGFAYGRMSFFGDWDGELRFPPYDPYALLYRHTIGLSALARREVFADTEGFDPEFEQFEDWEHWVNALEKAVRSTPSPSSTDAMQARSTRATGPGIARRFVSFERNTRSCTESLPRAASTL